MVLCYGAVEGSPTFGVKLELALKGLGSGDGGSPHYVTAPQGSRRASLCCDHIPSPSDSTVEGFHW